MSQPHFEHSIVKKPPLDATFYRRRPIDSIAWRRESGDAACHLDDYKHPLDADVRRETALGSRSLKRTM